MAARPDDAKTFHNLHAGPDVLVLANAWDAQSAKLIADAGGKAIATSSAAVAWSHGFADGHHLPMDRLLVTIANIARVVSIPISVDMEGGYADDPAKVAENVRAVIDAGGVGMNIEDGKNSPDLQCRKIEAVRAAAAQAGVDFFINARCDVYLKKIAEGDSAVAESVKRGQAYKNAGADGFFLPGPTDIEIFRAVAAEVGLPLNVMARPGVPTLGELKAVGVRRLSAATAISHIAYNAATPAAAQFLATGDSDALWAVLGKPRDYNSLFS